MLASTYCGCSIHGDVCTGMFYTLAACNTMTCGMPNQVRKFVRTLIEKGLSDKEIFERMEKEFGASIWKPHLLR
jgi:cytochrome c-type biogenesis protein CcmH/NrfF